MAWDPARLYIRTGRRHRGVRSRSYPSHARAALSLATGDVSAEPRRPTAKGRIWCPYIHARAMEGRGAEGRGAEGRSITASARRDRDKRRCAAQSNNVLPPAKSAGGNGEGSGDDFDE